MRTLLLATALLISCTKSEPTKQAPIPALSVDQVAHEVTAGTAVAVDANGESTRKRMGVVPGAVLLSDSETFKLSELPADKGKELVFYCANTSCGASHQAAERAKVAGYSHVNVMPDGIAGWVKAGKKVQTL